MSKSKKLAQPMHIRGFYRLNVVNTENGSVVGDSGWHENLVTNEGFRNFMVRLLGGISGSSQLTFAALGTGGAPSASDTTLAGELVDAAGCRCALTVATSGSKTLQCTFTLASNVITSARNISNVGLFATSAVTAGTLFAGNTYASSALATNQAVNGTYQIQFA